MNVYTFGEPTLFYSELEGVSVIQVEPPIHRRRTLEDTVSLSSDLANGIIQFLNENYPTVVDSVKDGIEV